MRVLFLDIDGVLVTGASMRYWHWYGTHDKNGRKLGGKRRRKLPNNGYSGQTFDPICANNFRVLLELLPEDVKIVISSTWRMGRDTIEELKEILDHEHIDSSRVIGRTGSDDSGIRGREIQAWLNLHPEVTDFLILDDDRDMEHLKPRLVRTLFAVGLTLPIVTYINAHFRGVPLPQGNDE